MRLQILPDERFSCRSCTDCCRRWYVELFDGEAEKIEKLSWPAGDPLRDRKGLIRHGGKTYLVHESDGACVFLNRGNNLCRIHEQFGVEAKPMACRLYPFQMAPTFAGELSVTARYDCPTVRKNQGDAHTQALGLLEQYAKKGAEARGFDEATRCHLERDQIAAVAEFVSTLIGGFSRNEQRAMFILYLCDVLALTAADELDREALASVFGPMKADIEAPAKPAGRPGLIHRIAFRTLLAQHLRRDEDILDRRAGRLRRLISMAAFVCGFGGFRGLGVHHPAGSLRRARLFKGEARPSVETCQLLWRLVRNKLDSFQFMGQANGERDFLTGLRSLALLYPLVLAAARHHAASRASANVEAQDMDYAVPAIEHSFGRSAVMGFSSMRSLEKLLLDRKSFGRLIQTL